MVPRQTLQQGGPTLPPRSTTRPNTYNLNNNGPPLPSRNKGSFLNQSPSSPASPPSYPLKSPPLSSSSSPSNSSKPLSSYSAISTPPPSRPPPPPRPNTTVVGTRIDPSTVEFSPKPTLQNLNTSPPVSSYNSENNNNNNNRKPLQSVSQPLPPQLPARSKAPPLTSPRPYPSPSPSPSVLSSSSSSPSSSAPPPPLPSSKPIKTVSNTPLPPTTNYNNNNNNNNNLNTANISKNDDSGETLINSNNPLSAKVVKGFQKEDFAVYQVDFKWKDNTWTVFRRFRQFADLNDAFGAVLWPDYVLPAKTLLPPKFSEPFVEKRREGLDHFLAGCCQKMNILLANDKHRRALFRFIKPAQLGDIKGANFSNDIFKEL